MCVKTGQEYDEAKAVAPTAQAQTNRLCRLVKQAKTFGMQLVPIE